MPPLPLLSYYFATKYLAADIKFADVVELTTQLLILENILWLPLCRINKFGLNTLPSKTVAIPYTCGLSDAEADEVVMKLSIHVVTGTSCKESVKLQGMIGKTHLLIRVDSGSSNSFVSEKLVQQLQCLVEMLPAATVKVAGGGTLTCT